MHCVLKLDKVYAAKGILPPVMSERPLVTGVVATACLKFCQTQSNSHHVHLKNGEEKQSVDGKRNEVNSE